MKRSVLIVVIGSDILVTIVLLAIIVAIWIRVPHVLPQRQGGWWTEQDAGLIGGIGGSIVGMLGGLIGTLGGCGKARRLVLTICAVSAGLGVASLVTGLAAVVLRQPYSVCFPLLLFGILVPAVMGPMFFLMRYGYEQRELQRMAAMDAGFVRSLPKGKP